MKSGCQSSRAFTLVELLVVISVIAVLMAVLMPSLRRVRNQARAMVCQSNLRQWGVFWSTYCAEYDGKIDLKDRGERYGDTGTGEVSIWYFCDPNFVGVMDDPKVRCCPMATRCFEDQPSMGGVYSAWHMGSHLKDFKRNRYGPGSYGLNNWVGRPLALSLPEGGRPWLRCDVKDAKTIPFIMDSALVVYYWDSEEEPPSIDTKLIVDPQQGHLFFTNRMTSVVIDRHSGGINCLFLDWSVRKVGIKELWTLKWHKDYNTQGRWTKAGGVQPEHWPEWMRRYKDY